MKDSLSSHMPSDVQRRRSRDPKSEYLVILDGQGRVLHRTKPAARDEVDRALADMRALIFKEQQSNEQHEQQHP